MGKNNLNADATDQELMNAGFKRKAHDIDGYDYSFSKELINGLILCVHIQRESCYGHLYYKGNILKSLKPTKAAINAEFKHFNQPLPQWEKPKPHQYSYKGLKAEGKIPHDRSGEDHDSIEAFKKLLAICEALNGMFEEEHGVTTLRKPYWSDSKDLQNTVYEHQDESPIYFTSEEAFEAFKSAPENVELFKTFLKIK